jgi:hypothetical protein
MGNVSNKQSLSGFSTVVCCCSCMLICDNLSDMKKRTKHHSVKTAPLRQHPVELILKCFAEKKGNIWQGFCIDLNLACQGATVSEVRSKLHEQIADYLFDALAGEDRAFASQLLNRPAPFSIRFRYYYLLLLSHVRSAHSGLCELFNETMPLVPARA